MILNGKYKLNEINKNGHMYSEDVFKEAVQNGDKIPGHLYITGDPDIECTLYKDVCMYTTLTIEAEDVNNTYVNYTSEILDTPDGKLAKALITSGTRLYPVPLVIGTLNENNEVEDGQLLSIDLSTSNAFED